MDELTEDDYPKGAAIVCGFCGMVAYQFARDIKAGSMSKSGDILPVDPRQDDLADGDLMPRCAECGEVIFHPDGHGSMTVDILAPGDWENTGDKYVNAVHASFRRAIEKQLPAFRQK